MGGMAGRFIGGHGITSVVVIDGIRIWYSYSI